MKKNYLNKIVLSSAVVILTCIPNCSKDQNDEQQEYIQRKMAENENAVLLKQFKLTPVQSEIVNTEFFNKISELKPLIENGEISRIEAVLSICDINPTKARYSDKVYSGQVLDEERIMYNSISSAFTKSDGDYIAICDFYLDQVSCLKIDDNIKSEFLERITFFKDFLIYIENAKYKSMDSYNAMLKTAEVPFDNCYDDCMVSELEHLGDSKVRLIIFILRLPISAAEVAVDCISQCI